MNALKDRKSFIKAIRTAKRVASGKRAAAACSACKKGRARCDDTRPCKRCRSLGLNDGCEIIETTGDTRDPARSVCVREVETFAETTASKHDYQYCPDPSISFSGNLANYLTNAGTLAHQQIRQHSQFCDQFAIPEPGNDAVHTDEYLCAQRAANRVCAALSPFPANPPLISYHQLQTGPPTHAFPALPNMFIQGFPAPAGLFSADRLPLQLALRLPGSAAAAALGHAEMRGAQAASALCLSHLRVLGGLSAPYFPGAGANRDAGR